MMTSGCCAVAAVVVRCLAVRGRATTNAKAARATLDQAIEAMGGAKLLAAEASLSRHEQGHARGAGQAKSPVTNEWTVQGPDQLKWTTE